ncbi:MAG: zinc-dependent peptidase [Bacteroidota bacterium]
MQLALFFYALYFYFLVRYAIKSSIEFGGSDYTCLKPSFYEYCDTLFQSRIAFYRNLDKHSREKFIYRVHEFIRTREWVGFYEFEMQSEHRAIVAACAVQLTFGLKRYGLEHIKRIFIAPEIFYSRLLQRDVKGLTMAQAIYLSWEDVEKGIDVSDDAYNLCLHEFAHALKLSVLRDDVDTDANYLSYLDEWEEQSDRVFIEMNESSENKNFLRGYAATNKHEFFAVCVENFFEKSKLFRDSDPRLFLSLCHLLNINPLNETGNYKLEKTFVYFENKNNNIFRYDHKVSLKFVTLSALFGFLMICLVNDRYAGPEQFFASCFITLILYKVTHRSRNVYSGRFMLKVIGIFMFAILPTIYSFFCLL